MTKQISVIVPVYNVADYLEKCISSIQNQTYKNLEIILVNDGSTDKSGIICDKIAEKDNRVKVIHQVNSGVSSARNAGICASTGTFITFIDGDDWIEKDAFEKMILYDEDISFCRFYRNYSDEQVEYYEETLYEIIRDPSQLQFFEFENKYERTKKEIFTDIIFGSVCRSIFRKDIIIQNNIYFDLDVKLGEDKLFLLKYMTYVNKAKLVDAYLYHYRSDRNNSAVATLASGYRKNLYQTRKDFIKRELEIFERNPRMEDSQKKEIKMYLGYKLCYDVILNELIFSNEPVEKLKSYFHDINLSKEISYLSFLDMKKRGYSMKTMVFYLMIKMKMWRILVFLYRNKGR